MAQDHFGRRQYPPQEPRPQPDPMRGDGTVRAPWKWAITAAIAVVFLLATYRVTTHRDEHHAATPPAATGSVPQTPGSGGPGVNRPGG